MKKGVCTYCGSNVEFSGDQSEIVCPYCREQIKTQKAEKRLLELQRERRRAIAFLVNFIVFGIGTIFIIGCFSGKEFTILPTPIHKKGDLDGNDRITILDVRLLLQAFINSNSSTLWTEEQLEIMDMDDNGRITIVDVRLLLQVYINQ